jgi:hypothetical protein
MFYPNAEARFFSFEGSISVPCTVRIKDNLIFVVCKGNGEISFKGVLEKGGHYVLRSDESDSLAYLHAANPKRLEGSTFYANDEGMWRINLGDAEKK